MTSCNLRKIISVFMFTIFFLCSIVFFLHQKTYIFQVLRLNIGIMAGLGQPEACIFVHITSWNNWLQVIFISALNSPCWYYLTLFLIWESTCLQISSAVSKGTNAPKISWEYQLSVYLSRMLFYQILGIGKYEMSQSAYSIINAEYQSVISTLTLATKKDQEILQFFFVFFYC